MGCATIIVSQSLQMLCTALRQRSLYENLMGGMKLLQEIHHLSEVNTKIEKLN